MSNIYSASTARGTSQTTREPGLVQNHAGGYVFTLGTFEALDRFLILGNSNPTYYASKQATMQEGLAIFKAAWAADQARVIRRVVELDSENRVMRRATLIFALAFAFAQKPDDGGFTRAACIKVLRTASDFFQFIDAYKDLGGKTQGGAFRAMVRDWYDKDPIKLAYQVTKYRNRSGWTHRDMLRLGHVTPTSPEIDKVFSFAVGKYERSEGSDVEAYLNNYLDLQAATTKEEVIHGLSGGFTWEQVPQSMIKDVSVWTALAERMPLMALTRNIGRMLSYGVPCRLITDRLRDKAAILRSRMHPMHFLQAWGVQGMGHGVKGSLTWTPNEQVGSALEDAFHASYGNLERIDKKIMVALDVSGSMDWSSGLHGLNCRQASAAIALVLNQQADVETFGFSTEFVPLPIGSNDLSGYIGKISCLRFGGTDCALPFLMAEKRYDAFVVITDSETWQGNVKVPNALRMYEKKYGATKLIVVAMTSTGFTIADPLAGNQLDIVGMDSNVPKLIANFIND